MKKKTLAIGGIIAILLLGIMSASLIDYFGRITGSVEVRNPVFYLDKTDIMGDDSYSLKLNNDIVSGTWFKLDSEEFFSKKLGIDSFYSHDFKIYLNTKVYGLDENQTASIYIAMFIAREDGSVKETLCSNLRIGVIEDDIYEISCSVTGDGMDNMNENDRLKLLINDGSPTEDYINIYLEDSKVEIVPK